MSRLKVTTPTGVGERIAKPRRGTAEWIALKLRAAAPPRQPAMVATNASAPGNPSPESRAEGRARGATQDEPAKDEGHGMRTRIVKVAQAESRRRPQKPESQAPEDGALDRSRPVYRGGLEGMPGRGRSPELRGRSLSQGRWMGGPRRRNTLCLNGGCGEHQADTCTREALGDTCHDICAGCLTRA